MGFIKDKLILRPILACIVPILLYSIGFGILSLSNVIQTSYFNYIPWICIGVISLIYPINHIGLFMLFEPFQWMLRRKLMIKYNKMFEGNFKKIEEDG